MLGREEDRRCDEFYVAPGPDSGRFWQKERLFNAWDPSAHALYNTKRH